jgi:hypothetical protein
LIAVKITPDGLAGHRSNLEEGRLWRTARINSIKATKE